MSATFPDLPDAWASTAPVLNEGNAQATPEDRAHVPRASEGHEQEAKDPKGEGQWASMGELLM